MRKIILGILALGVIFATGIFLSENVSRLDAERPTLKTPALEPLAERLSRATIPVSVPIAAVGEALERRTPKQESGLKKNALGERFAQSELSWDLKRSDLRVSGRSGALSVATELSGEARATGVLKLVRKIDVSASGDVLASVSLTASPTLKTNWRVSPNLSETKIDIQRADIPIKRIGNLDVSASGDVLASVSLTASPTLETNWRVSPNLSETKIDIQRADIPIKRIGNLDVREHILPGVGITADKLRTQLNRSVARSDFFEQAAREGWKRLCGSTPLGEDSGLWLETKPVVARAAQIRIDRKNIRATIGVEVKTRLLTERTQPRCPFPKTLLIEKPKPGGFEIVMPALLDYETLERTLAEEVVGKSLGKNVSVLIKAIRVRPYGEGLLLETTVSVETDYLSGTTARGTLYVLAEPKLNAKAQTLTLENVKLETDSQNVLFSMAGKAAEPLLLDAVSRRIPFDLGPKLKELRDGSENALSALSSENISVTGKVNRVRITRLDVGPEHLRLLLTAEGRMRATVRAIP